MRILVAPDSFKGTLTAIQAAEALACGIRQVVPDCRIEMCPLSDGGEGLVSLIARQHRAQLIPVHAQGPLSEPVTAHFCLLDTPVRTAVQDVASVIGLPLVPPAFRNPYMTTSRGVADLLKAAFDLQVHRIIVGLGGSSTVDGGIGMAAGLGFEFLNDREAPFVPAASTLTHITRILPPKEQPWRDIRLLAATDVRNVLCGPRGAARVFGPQKGATPAQVEALETGLAHLAGLWRRDLGIDTDAVQGGGAAGGLGAALYAFCGTTLGSGIELFFQLVNFNTKVQQADIIVTGEGKFDDQSLDGKVIDGVTRVAQQYGKPVLVVAGQTTLRSTEVPVCIAGISSLSALAPDAPAAEREAAFYAEKAAAQAMQQFLAHRKSPAML